MGEIKKDCRCYVNDSVKYGCTGLKKLLCKTEKKPCKFYKPGGKVAVGNG